MIHIKHGDKELWVHWSETKTFCADWERPCVTGDDSTPIGEDGDA